MSPIWRDTLVAILAGGKSRRFGKPKLQARIEARTFLERSLDLASALSSSSCVVVATGAALPVADAPVLEDLYQDIGPLAGIVTALRASRLPYVCTLPCDMPLLSAAVFETLYAKRVPGQPVVARSPKGLEPLIAIWPAAAAPVVEGCIRRRRLNIRAPLRELGAVVVDLEREMDGYRPELMTNINYPEDLKRLRDTRTMWEGDHHADTE
ncbi:MAG: molybdenum cofactor guanylyltransferase [Synergistales bacterium]|nr:molybdenum cofactor guanylyltransferase [Synergistales bacterium]